MAATSSLDSLFDPRSEILHVGPLTDPAGLADFLEEHPKLDIPGEYVELIRRSRPTQIRRTLASWSLRRGATLRQVERVLRHRGTDPWSFGWLLRVELEEAEGPLEGGGSQNLFWLPQPVTAYWETTDNILHVRSFERDRLARFDKVIVGGTTLA